MTDQPFGPRTGIDRLPREGEVGRMTCPSCGPSHDLFRVEVAPAADMAERVIPDVYVVQASCPSCGFVVTQQVFRKEGITVVPYSSISGAGRG